MNLVNTDKRGCKYPLRLYSQSSWGTVDLPSSQLPIRLTTQCLALRRKLIRHAGLFEDQKALFDFRRKSNICFDSFKNRNRKLINFSKLAKLLGLNRGMAQANGTRMMSKKKVGAHCVKPPRDGKVVIRLKSIVSDKAAYPTGVRFNESC